MKSNGDVVMLKHYVTTPEGIWTGRVDSTTDYDAFRWHQWIECIDLNNQDLKPFDGAFGVALIGYSCDEGVRLNKGRPGAEKGPEHIRRELVNLPCHFKPGFKLFDVGDVKGNGCPLAESQEALGRVVERVLSLNLYPIVMGGGHEVAFGNYQGIMTYLKEKEDTSRLGIVNFDAHFDIRPYEESASSGTMFRQIADLCASEGRPFDYYCLGIQQRGNTRQLFNTAQALSVRYDLARDITQEKLIDVFASLDRFMKNQDAIYVTICMDVFASAYAPGVSSAQPLGLQPWIVLTALKHIIRSEKMVSFDIAEVSPRFDRDNVTANLASTVIFHVVQELAEVHELYYENVF
jgi:formiminoglutamase